MLVARAKVKPAETVLVNAASSGLSTAAIQLCKHMGAFVIAASSTDAKLEKAKEIGADEVINYNTVDTVKAVYTLTGGRGVDVAVEHTGGESLARPLRCLTQGGRLVTVGGTLSYDSRVPLHHIFHKELKHIGSNSAAKSELEAAFELLARGELRLSSIRSCRLKRRRRRIVASRQRNISAKSFSGSPTRGNSVAKCFLAVTAAERLRMATIRSLLEPTSIAVIGASSNPDKPGGTIFSQLIRGGYQGQLFPINPNANENMGRQSYAHLLDVPCKVDLVFIVVPRELVEGAVRQCADAGAASACIITAGFSEAGQVGREAERRLLEIARSSGLRLAGPNNIGVINVHHHMMGSFVDFPNWQKGGISIFSQSGTFNGAPMLEWMEKPIQRPPVSKVVAVGNKIDIDEIDFLDYAESDPATKAIGLYLESVRKPDAFFKALARVRSTKPIVVMKSGRTPQGAAASRLHTGSEPVDDAIIDAGLAAAQSRQGFR
jgi:predicted CoA-binding protein